MNDKTPPNDSPQGRELEEFPRDYPGDSGTKELVEAIRVLFQQAGISPSEPKAQLVIQLAQKATSYKGPIPPPEMLREYGKVVPGLKKTIIESWQRQQDHRHEIEDRVTTRAEDRMDRAQRNSLYIAFSGIVAAVVVGIYGSPFAAAAIVLVAVGGPAGASILGRWLPPPRE